MGTDASVAQTAKPAPRNKPQADSDSDAGRLDQANTTTSVVTADLDASTGDDTPRGWQRRLTFDRAQVAGRLENFPLLVRLTDAHLGVFAATDGQDIHFVALSGGMPLDHELERFDAARGELTAWVRLPKIDNTTDPVIYLAYADGRSHPSRTASVWRDHHYVWHLSDDLNKNEALARDATGRAHAAVSGAMTRANSIAGIAGSALEFDGRDDELVFENDLTGNTPSTIQAWVFQGRTQTAPYGSAILMIGEQASDRARFLLSLEAGSGAVRYGFYNNDRGNVAIATEVWRSLVWTWDGTRSSFFIDGRLVEGPAPHMDANTTGRAGRIGNAAFASPRYDFFLAGALDEVRVSTVARSREWIATEFANQRPGSTFLKTIDEPEPAR